MYFDTSLLVERLRLELWRRETERSEAPRRPAASRIGSILRALLDRSG